MSKITLELDLKSDLVRVTTYSPHNLESIKYITYQDLVGALKQGVEFATPILSPNTIYYRSRVLGKGSEIDILYWDKVRIREVCYLNKNFTIPTPNCLFKFIFKPVISDNSAGRFSLVHGFCFALPSDGCSLNSPIYNFPFSNVDKITGAICWGKERPRNLVDLAEVGSIVDFFWTQPFNNHLDRNFSAFSHDGFKIDTSSALMNVLQGSTAFPVNSLKLWGNVQDIISKERIR